MTGELVTAAQLAKVLGCSSRSVLRGFELGRFPGYRVSPRRVAFDLAEVLTAMREDRAGPERRG